MENYLLVNNYGKSNTPDRIYYIMRRSDLPNLIKEESVVFGDKAYILEEGTMMFMGNDGIWYDTEGEVPIITAKELNATENGTYADPDPYVAYRPVNVQVTDYNVEGLNVTENGTYSESGKAYSPVVVNVPLPENAYLKKDLPTGAIATVTDAEVEIMPSLKVAITPVQSGSGDPSPDNIRPISGWTEANVYNDIYPPIYWNQLASLLSANWYKNRGTFTSSGNDIIFTNSYNSGLKYFNKSIKKGHIFYIGTPGITISNSKVDIEIYDGSGTKRTTLATISTNERTPFYIIFKDTTGYDNPRFGFTRPTDSPNSSTLTIEDLQIYDLTAMFGAERAEEIRRMADRVNYIQALFPKNYYAYNTGEKTTVGAVNGDTSGIYNVNWQTEAGTVYGGTLDVVNGTLTVDMAMVDLGTLNWRYATDAGLNVFYIPSLSGAKNNGSLMCSNYVIGSPGKTSSQIIAIDKEIWWNSGGTGYVAATSLMIKDSSYTSASSFKTAMNGVQLVYKLATPQTYQLTPTEVQMLLGTNNLWADTGDILEGKYWSKNPVTVTQAMLSTLRSAGEITEITEPEEPEEPEELEELEELEESEENDER